MTTIPTSGAFLRAFAGASMTAGTRHVATVLASAISYNGKYRGAPRGHAAFTMTELQEITGLAARTIHAALTELAQLFGLTIIRRHHQRHFFRFTRIAAERRAVATIETATGPGAETTEATVTGSELPASPYIEEQKDNNCFEKVKIRKSKSVYHTPWASFIDRFKQGTPAEEVDTQFLWNGFCQLNRRNGHDSVPLRFLIGFLSKYPKRKQRFAPKPGPEPAAQPLAKSIGSNERHVIEMARPAPFQNRHFHKSDLQGKIGSNGYEARVTGIMERFKASRFAAELAVHGEAIRCGEIRG